MSQPQPCAHDWDNDSFVCLRCGVTAQSAVDMSEVFGACWRGTETENLSEAAITEALSPYASKRLSIRPTLALWPSTYRYPGEEPQT